MTPAGDRRPDLRTTALGAAAWAGALGGLHARGWLLVTAVLTVAGCAAVAALGGRRTAAGLLLTAAALGAAAGARVEAATGSVVATWAGERAVAELRVTVRSDPRPVEGRYGSYVVAEARTDELTVRGRTAATSVPVLLTGDEELLGVPLGSVVRLRGRLGAAADAEHAAVVRVVGELRVLRGPPGALRAADRVRASVREAASAGPGPGDRLVPALVTGDDQALDAEVVADFRTAGLTHLTAVSGTNLTLVLGFLLGLARWGGVRGRGFPVLGLLGVAGFVLLARPEPSVVRAAAMGTVALLGLSAGGRAAGVRALGAAVLLLLVLDPWLAASPGFALSAMATAGILFVAPELRDALARWAPRWLAEAVAVPLAAQLACTPVVAALSGEVSLVAVVANLLVAPAVGPATVLGLVAGLVGLAVPWAGEPLGWVAGWCAQGIVVVAERAAGLPTAAVAVPTTAAALAVLTGVTVAVTLLAPAVLRRPLPAAVVAVVLALAVGGLAPVAGWPPRGWVLVMCDVGQGDALAVRTGAEAALVVDAGPDPAAVRRCLDRLDVRAVPAVVLTHFHADHVDGLPGVLEGRDVGEVQVSVAAEPAAGARRVAAWARQAGVPLRVPEYAEEGAAGPVRWRVLGPRRAVPGSPNDSSVVLLVETAGLRVLLAGDVEPPAQAALAAERVGVVDVLKVPHHGSGHQDEDFLEGLAPRVALVPVGEDNDYGHPDPDLLRLLEAAGAVVRRSDRDGDVALAVRDGGLRVVARGG